MTKSKLKIEISINDKIYNTVLFLYILDQMACAYYAAGAVSGILIYKYNKQALLLRGA